MWGISQILLLVLELYGLQIDKKAEAQLTIVVVL